VLRVPLAELQATADPLSGHPQTLEGAERDHIRQALCDTQGLVAGPSGAAARLGLKRTTLLYKMEKLGITSHEFRNQRHLP
jgi:formate hydrogenlyase transcriptional activator